MRVVTIVLISLTVTLVIGCGGVDVVAERQALLDTDTAFSRMSVEKGPAEAFYIYLADEAVQLPGGGPPVFGRDMIYQGMSSGADYTMTWTPQDAEVSACGDLGYTWGLFEVHIPAESGETRIGYGKYLNVWKKQADGSWKVVIDIGNQNPEPSED